MLSRRIPQVNCQDHMVQLGNYFYLSIRMASIDGIKIQPLKDYHDSDSNCIILRTGKTRVRSAEVRSLAPVLKKSATVLKLKPKLKLLRCKNTVHIATLNNRTLNRIGQLPELTASATEHNIDFVYIQEHRYSHSEIEIKYLDTGNRWTFIPASAWKISVLAS